MKIKVNRVKNITEARKLIEAQADILSFTIDRLETKDKTEIPLERHLSLEDFLVIERSLPNDICFCLDLTDAAVNETIINEIKTINADYIGMFFDLFEYSRNDLSLIENLSLLSKADKKLILFGDGIGYDTWFGYDIEDYLKLSGNPTIEYTCDSVQKMKFSLEIGYKQDDVSDLLIDTVNTYFDSIPSFIQNSDKEKDFVNYLDRFKTQGVSFSLGDNNEVDYDNFKIEREPYYCIEELIETIEILKNNFA